MKMFLAAVCSLFLASAIQAMTTPNEPRFECPRIEVMASDQTVTDGDPLTFQFVITGGDLDLSNVHYNWVVDRGEIQSGQGTAVIVVDTTGQGPAGSITATAQASSLGPICPFLVSETVYIRRKGVQTKEDLFWKWIQQNEDKLFYSKTDQEIQTSELQQKLTEVEPTLKFEFGPRTDGSRTRQFVIITNGKKPGSSVAKTLLDRAPVLALIEVKIREEWLKP